MSPQPGHTVSSPASPGAPFPMETKCRSAANPISRADGIVGGGMGSISVMRCAGERRPACHGAFRPTPARNHATSRSSSGESSCPGLTKGSGIYATIRRTPSFAGKPPALARSAGKRGTLPAGPPKKLLRNWPDSRRHDDPCNRPERDSFFRHCPGREAGWVLPRGAAHRRMPAMRRDMMALSISPRGLCLSFPSVALISRGTVARSSARRL
jgi:hypothetical protein